MAKKHSTMSRTVRLKGGGSVEVSTTCDIWKLTDEDRKFLFGLIDRVAQYEKDETAAAPELPFRDAIPKGM